MAEEDPGPVPKTRGRFTGSGEDLAGVLGPFMEVGGKSFIRYPSEKEKVQDAKTCPESIAKHAELILKCKVLQGNWAFAKKPSMKRWTPWQLSTQPKLVCKTTT